MKLSQKISKRVDKLLKRQSVSDKRRLSQNANPVQNDAYTALLQGHEELIANHRALVSNHQTLVKNHQKLEDVVRKQEREIFRLQHDEKASRLSQLLAAEDLYLVGDIIIEAPSPPVSSSIRDALAESGYESVELYLVRNLVRPGDTVLDLGSGLGVTSIAAAKAAQGGRVVGYEADPRVAGLAQKNAERNGVAVEIRNRAVSRDDGELVFYTSPDFLANSLYEFEGAQKISVPSSRFQSVIDEVRPAVISCDIEGVEGDIFAGADLSSVRRMIVETHEQYLGTAGVEKCIADLAACGLHQVESLCWGPVLVFDRDGSAKAIPPFELNTRGQPHYGYASTIELHDVPDPTLFDDVASFRRGVVAADAPLVWYSPNWLHWWGGGILTILRFAKMISDRGVRTIIYVYDNAGFPTLAKLRQDLDDAFPGHSITLTTDISTLPAGHIAMATTYQSTFAVLRAPLCSERFYFMQEYESLLYPGGTQAEQANATYRMGFKGICGGTWLRAIFQHYGGEAINFNFSHDRSIFYPSEVREEVKRLFFFGRPSSDRRMYDLGVAVLQEINRRHPDVEIVIAGLDGLAELPFPATCLGNLQIEKTGELYRTCDIGLTFSGSNMSYLPVELMASGVPVLTNAGPQVEWYCEHGINSYVCQPYVSDFVRGFEALMASYALRQKLVEGGLATVAQMTWEKEAEKLYTHIAREVRWQSAPEE